MIMIGFNHIGIEAVIALSAALKVNTGLKELDLC